MDSDLLQGFYLNNVLVEPRKGQVLREGEAVHLPPKAMEVLLALASRPAALVPRQALIDKVWGAGQGSPEALVKAISEIRHALDDHPDEPRFVQTLPRQGYRLIAKPVPTARPPGGAVDGGDSASVRASFFDDLKERGVVQAAIAYILAAWLIMQVADTFLSLLNLPAWSGTFVAVLVVAGFPIVLVLAWFLEFRDGRAVLDRGSGRVARHRRFSRTYLSVVGALAIAAVGVYVYDAKVGLPQAEEPPPAVVDPEANLPPVRENSIAVLPFLNLDGSEETQIFANGLVDDVINRLSRVPGLLVSSRGDAFTLEPNSASSQVRDRLRVALYLEGSVQMSGDRMRIIVQLIDSNTGFHRLSRSFDRLRVDFFEIRDEITQLTVANVRVALPPGVQTAADVLGEDPSLDVYVLYRRGIEALRLSKTVETLTTGLNWFEAALAIDHDYAAAHAGNCLAFVDLYPVTNDPTYIASAEGACARALELNPNLDVVHAALGDLYRATGRNPDAEAAYLAALEIHPRSVEALIGLANILRLEQKYEQAEERYRQAIGMHPGDWTAYNALGFFLFSSGRFQEAAEQFEYVVALDDRNTMGFGNLGTAYMMAGNFEAAGAAFRKALEIEPRQVTYSNLGLMHYYLGRLDEAINAHRQALELVPNDHLAWSNLGDALWVAGRQQESTEAYGNAERLVGGALEVNPSDPGFLMDQAWITAMLGKQDVAAQSIGKALELAPDDPWVHYIQGLVLARNGEEDLAVSAFEAAIARGYSAQMLAADPMLDMLRDSRRFQRVTGAGKTR